MGLITFINVAIGVSLGGLLYTIWPEHYFSWYPSIPFFSFFSFQTDIKCKSPVRGK